MQCAAQDPVQPEWQNMADSTSYDCGTQGDWVPLFEAWRALLGACEYPHLGEAKAAEKPSIAGSKKPIDIVEERNKIAFGQPAQDQLFGGDDDDKAPTEAMAPPKKKRKPKPVLEYPESLGVSVHGECFTAQWPSKKRDDLCVLFTPDHLTKVFDYLFGELEISIGGSKRAYSRTGGYKKDNDKSDQSSLDEAEED